MLYVYVANLHQDCIAQAVTDHQMIHFWYLSELTGHPRAISSTINMRLWEATEDLDRHPDDCVDDWESKIQCVPSWSSVHSMHKHWQRMSSIQHRLIRHPRALSWPQHAPHFFFFSMENFRLCWLLGWLLLLLVLWRENGCEDHLICI